MDLNCVAPLLSAWVSDPWGKLRPPLSEEAVCLSAELAEATYRMDVEKWIRAGWRDVTIQVDGDLTDGLSAEGEGPVQWLANAWKMYRVRQRIRQRNPLGQVMGAFRQREKSDTGKALVMIHPADNGRYVVAIAFMGTGERFYDWFSNLRMTAEGGVHQGFLQLTRQFEDNEGEIDFPDTAAELGLERLTLKHVLQEAKHPNSRFTVWLCGHSQGAALAQVYAHRKIHLDGVLPRNLVGYGFAAPSVMTGLAVADPAAYPLYLIQNSDDLVPRLGSEVHLGVCLMYPADEALRRSCYDWQQDEAACARRAAVIPILRRMNGASGGIEVTTAFINVLAKYNADDLVSLLGTLGIRLPVKRMLNAADQRVDMLLRLAKRHLAAAHVSITGRMVDKARIAEHQAMIAELVSSMGVRTLMETLVELLGQPHRMTTRAGGQESPYHCIARCGLGQLIPAIWFSGRPPWMITAAQATSMNIAGQFEVINRRMARPAKRMQRLPHRAWAHPYRHTRHTVPTPEPGSFMPGERIVQHD